MQGRFCLDLRWSHYAHGSLWCLDHAAPGHAAGALVSRRRDGIDEPGYSDAAPAEKSYPSPGDGLTFTSAPFTEETEFTGPIGARLWVSSTTADMDILAAVRLIDPQGHDVTFMSIGAEH
jgi:predicted acyl esterase